MKNTYKYLSAVNDLFRESCGPVENYRESPDMVSFRIDGVNFKITDIMRLVDIFGTDNINIAPKQENIRLSEYSSDSWSGLDVEVFLP